MTDFQSKVLDSVKMIPEGKVSTYGAIALHLGNPKASRAVGNALHNNPTPIIVPCHRVVNGQGKLAKNFGFGGVKAQAERLRAEGVVVFDDKVDLDEFGWFFG